MSLPFTYVPLEMVPPAPSLVVAGVPGSRGSGALAAGFLVSHLGLRLVGSFHSDALPPVGVVHEGHLLGPVEVWVSDMPCGPSGGCSRLIVMKSEIPLNPVLLNPLASVVALQAKTMGGLALVALEGTNETLHSQTGVDKTGPLIAWGRGAEPLARLLGVTPLDDTILSGFAPALVERADALGLPAVALVTGSPYTGSEAGSAAELVRVVHPIVPNADVDPFELARHATRLEEEMHDWQRRHARGSRVLAEAAMRGYV